MSFVVNICSGVIHDFEMNGVTYRRLLKSENCEPIFYILSKVNDEWVGLNDGLSVDDPQLVKTLEEAFQKEFNIENNVPCPFCGDTMQLFTKKGKKEPFTHCYTCITCRTNVNHIPKH